MTKPVSVTVGNAAGAPPDAPAADRRSLRHRLTVDGSGHVVGLVVHGCQLAAADGVEEHRAVEDPREAAAEALVRSGEVELADHPVGVESRGRVDRLEE